MYWQTSLNWRKVKATIFQDVLNFQYPQSRSHVKILISAFEMIFLLAFDDSIERFRCEAIKMSHFEHFTRRRYLSSASMSSIDFIKLDCFEYWIQCKMYQVTFISIPYQFRATPASDIWYYVRVIILHDETVSEHFQLIFSITVITIYYHYFISYI